MAFDTPDVNDSAAPSAAPDSSQQMVSPTPQAATPNIQGAPQVPQRAAPQLGNAQPQQPAQPSVVTPPVAPSRNQQLHGFVSSVLSGISKSLAGAPATKYTTDASGRLVTDPNQPADTRGAQVRRIGANALEGLAAGAQVPQQKSGLASALAGLGAGAGAQIKDARQQDDKARQQARENEEAAEQKMLRMHEIAKGNALLLSTYLEMNRTAQDHDPIRKQHADWAQAAEANGAPVKYMSESELATARQADPATIGKYQVLNLGVEPLKDNDGNVVVGTDGKPKMEGRFALIDGMHDGNMNLPASMVSDLQKYGKYAGVTGEDDLKAGQSVSMPHYIQLANAIREGRKQELQGWAQAEDGFSGPDSKIPGQINKFTREFRPNPAGAMTNAQKKDTSTTPNEELIQNREDARNQARINAENQRAELKRKQDQADGKNTDVFGNTSSLPGKEFDKRYDKFNSSKQYQNLSTLQGSYDQFQDAISDLNSGKPLTGAASVVGLFNAIGISATPLAGKGFRINENTIKEHTDARGMDQAAYQKLLSLKNGDVITPQQLRDYAKIATDVYAESYINAANEQKRQLGYIDVLPLGNNRPVDPVTARIYLRIAGADKQLATDALRKSGWAVPQSNPNQNPTQAPTQNSTPAAGPSANQGTPAPNSHVFDPVAWQRSHPGQDVNAAIKYAQSQGFQVKQ